MTYLVLGLWSVVCLFPVYWLIVVSLTGTNDIDRGPHYLPFVDFAPSLRAWYFILADPYENLLTRFLNSAVIAFGSSVLSILFGSMAIYGMTRFRMTWSWVSLGFFSVAIALVITTVVAGSTNLKLLTASAALLMLLMTISLRSWTPHVSPGGLMIIVLATRILPPVVVVLPIYLMAWQTGTLDTRIVLILTYAAVNLPVAMWLLQPVLGFAASAQEESAQLDGASHLRILFSITVPMAIGGIAATGLVIFVLGWNEYLFAAYLATDHAMTLPPWAVGQLSMKEAQIGGEAEEWANLSAATVLMALPLLGLTVFVQRQIGLQFKQRRD